MPTLEKTLAFFFEGQKTLVAKPVPSAIDGVPGWYRSEQYQNGPFSMMSIGSEQRRDGDLFFISHLMIYHEGERVWMRNREGWFIINHQERLAEFCIAAWSVNWDACAFVGGLGPERFERDGLLYKNTAGGNLFTQFSGEDEVLQGDELIYWCDYHGKAWQDLS